MGRKPGCKLDRHPQRDTIDREIVAGKPFRAIIASHDGVTLGTLNRHKGCLKELLTDAATQQTSERTERGSALLDRVERLVASAEEILTLAKAKQDFRGANGALGAAAKLLDLLGRLSGELQSANAGGIHLTMNKTVNVVNYDNDADFAAMIGEATNGFSVDKLMELKQIADANKGAIPLLPCRERAPSL